MLHFRTALNHLEVKEVNLMGRKFTWSSNQQFPTMSRIDRMFYSPAWEDCYANPFLRPLSSSSSDHSPLLLMPLIPSKVKPKFKFESFWPSMPGFYDVVLEAWSKSVPASHNHMETLHIKLSRTAKALRFGLNP
jgi:hypothetical protein